MIDVHAHFAQEGYDIQAELFKIKAAGVKKLVLAGDDLLHSRMHAEIAQENDGVFFTAGIHPSWTEKWSKDTVSKLKPLCLQEKCVAVGEIGLDYHYENVDKETQAQMFRAQLRLAKELSLPVQIHSRDAAQDTLAILRENRDCLQNGLLLHCYSYSVEIMDEFLSLGAYFSFGGVACFKNAKKVVECVAHCPKDKILTETDSPYLSPYRGEKNTPANIPVILSRLAQIRGEEESDLREAIWKNAHALFPKLK